MLTKESELLQPDAFCENTVQQNASAGPSWGSLQCSPRPSSWFLRGLLCGREGEGKEGEEQGGRVEEVDSDAQLERAPIG